MPNRLNEAQSPYLRLHAHQKVNWWPWSSEAWEFAREKDLPVFVSLGYSACHWCHVMSEESFDDEAIARALNQGFVAIKVDREEHPDVDAAYMSATQALTGQGGWPNSVFCTPEGQPFYAGTYFPPEAAGGRPGFGDVLKALTQAWTDRRDEVLESGASIVEHLRAPEEEPAQSSTLREVRQKVAAHFDPLHGGFGKAPKFPPTMVIDALLVSGDPGELEMAQHTLEAMARGGIHDQLGGGFHRYAVDAAWVTPHFEKMLYDNALLLGSYVRGWRRTADHDGWKRSLWADVARRLVAWSIHEMRTDEGLFASSLDADSSDIRGLAHEGIYYVWNPDLLTDALGDELGDWAANIFHVTTTGTFELGLSTLQLKGHPDADKLAEVRAKLHAVRGERFRPARDDKVVAAWNGWFIDALVDGAMVLAEPVWLERAREAADALWRIHWEGEKLARTSLAGAVGAPGTCEDYAAVALAFGRLGAALGEPEWASRAALLLDRARALFADPAGGWFDAEANRLLYLRPKDVADSATPSATSTMVAALRLVGALEGRADFLAEADAAAKGQAAFMARAPVHAGWALRQAMIDDEARRGLHRASVLVGEDEPLNELSVAAWRMAPDGSVVVLAPEGVEWSHLALAEQPRGSVLVCRKQTCLPPATDVDILRTALWTRM